MSKTLRFEGYSDDTFGLVDGIDHDNCASGEPIEFHVFDTETAEGLIVTGQYCPGKSDGWLIGVSPYDPDASDEKPIPKWPITIIQGGRPYSPALIIDAPDTVEVRLMEPFED